MNAQLWQSIYTLQSSMLQLHHWHHHAGVHYPPKLPAPLHAATAPAVFYLGVRHMSTEVSLEEVLHACCWCHVCVLGLEPWFHNWTCCKVNKVINVFHQVSHLSRPTALPDNEVREPRSAPLLPAWPNWEAWVSARLRPASASAHHQ